MNHATPVETPLRDPKFMNTLSVGTPERLKMYLNIKLDGTGG